MVARGEIQPGVLDRMRPALCPAGRLAVEVWNRCGADPRWLDVLLIADWYGIDDVEVLWRLLETIRQHR